MVLPASTEICFNRQLHEVRALGIFMHLLPKIFWLPSFAVAFLLLYYFAAGTLEPLLL